MDRKGLFRTILGEVPREKETVGNVRAIPLETLALPESQPRRYFDEAAMDELVHSVRTNGILQPLLVRPLAGDGEEAYEVVAGERRYRAAQRAGLSEVPAMVRPMEDEEAARYALLENLQREDLNPVEETEGILALLSKGLDKSPEEVVSLLYAMSNRKKLSASRAATHKGMGNREEETVVAVFESLGKMTWESFVKNRLPLLNLPDDVLEALRAGRIAYTKARLVARIRDEKKRRALLGEAIREDLPLATLRDRANALLSKSSPPPPEDLPSRASALAKDLRRRGALKDREKRERLEALLAQMEELLRS